MRKLGEREREGGKVRERPKASWAKVEQRNKPNFKKIINIMICKIVRF